MRFARLPTLSIALATLLCAVSLHAQQPAESPGASPSFEFHSGFWINLHHFLYVQGRIRSAAGESRPGGPATKEGLPAPASVAGLSAEQQRAWNAAVDIYSADWSSRDLLLNGDMAVVNNRLAELENCQDLSAKAPPACQAGLRADLVMALDEAAPIYRAQWWMEQDRENRAWINGVAPLVRGMGAQLAAQLAEVYRRDWPPQAMRVDVVWSAGPLGAYTTFLPVHVTIASGDPRNQGLASFEILFHEASHVLSTELSQAIVRECRQRGKPIPRDLWHAVLYYTTGELARRLYVNNPQLGGNGTSVSGYTPYADRNGLYDHDWNQYRHLLEDYWQPYLDGKVSFDSAIARMVSAL